LFMLSVSLMHHLQIITFNHTGMTIPVPMHQITQQACSCNGN